MCLNVAELEKSWYSAGSLNGVLATFKTCLVDAEEMLQQAAQLALEPTSSEALPKVAICKHSQDTVPLLPQPEYARTQLVSL